MKRSHHVHYRVYYTGLAAVAGLSFGLRFWGLDRFDERVFDEVYYVQFAHAYLAGETVFDVHPPLGKYAIALGIWLSSQARWVSELELTPVSYRWMNAFVGSLTPLLAVGISQTFSDTFIDSYVRSKRWCFALLAGAFVAIDGLFVTESRYALLNVYLVFFGLLGHWLWLRATTAANGERLLQQSLSGVALGAAAAIKWNGLGYLLSLVIWESWRAVNKRELKKYFARSRIAASARYSFQIICNRVFFWGLLPLLTYGLIWWPHLRWNEVGFWELHRNLFLFHRELDTVQVACSAWFSWPLLIEPISYWYETAGEMVYAVNDLGNPALWWLSSAAVLMVGADKVRGWQRHGSDSLEDGLSDSSEDGGIVDYLLIGYMANWLPWIAVERCTYIYLFMPAAVFGFALLAWLLSGWLAAGSPKMTRLFGGLMLAAIAFSFFFWLPLSLGLPLTPEQLELRWWLPSWI